MVVDEFMCLSDHNALLKSKVLHIFKVHYDVQITGVK